MNSETGQIYEGKEEIKKALDRGEPLVPVHGRDIEKLKTIAESDRVAAAKHLAARRKARKSKRKAERKRRGRR